MTQPSIQQAFELALQHHQSGRLPQAEQAYRHILSLQSHHPGALHYLGLIAYQNGRHDIAIQLMQQSLSLQPDSPQSHSNLAIALRAAGRLDEAIAAFHHAIKINPNDPATRYNLGVALQDKNQLDQAIAQYQEAIALNPNFPEAHNNLGNALKIQNRPDEAIAAYRRAIALNPHYAQAHNNLGNILREQNQLPEAIAACRHAIALNPNLAEAHSNLGNALRDNSNLDEAIIHYQQAITLNPNLPEPPSNLANVLRDKGLILEAVAAARRTISLNPNFPEAHRNLAHLLLLQGDLTPAWPENEWRWQCRDFPSPPWTFPQPQWKGVDLTRRTLLLHAEQGLGDTLQFIRYIPLVAQLGPKILVQCPAELHQLLQSTPHVAQWLTPEETPPPFDLHCPLLSLPLALNTTPQTIPHQVPYIHPEPVRTAQWQTKLSTDPRPLKVGLLWSGNPAFKNNKTRMIPLAALAPLAQIPNVSFYSLQKGPPAAQAKNPPPGLNLIDHTADLQDFADTAALIANLDLVISTDTAVVHLAGTLAKPVWTLLQFVPDWRWLLQGSHCPWYPTMQLFRQPSLGDWNAVVSQVTENLAVLAKNRERYSKT